MPNPRPPARPAKPPDKRRYRPHRGDTAKTSITIPEAALDALRREAHARRDESGRAVSVSWLLSDLVERWATGAPLPPLLTREARP